jgi:hypothetical protein
MENNKMGIYSIELELKLQDKSFFEMLLVDYFTKDRSPVANVYIFFDVKIISKHPPRTGNLVTLFRYNYRVGEAQKNTDDGSRELAKIRIEPYPSTVMVFFDVDGSSDSDKQKVESLVIAIYQKCKERDFEIVSILPTDFLPNYFVQDVKKQSTNRFLPVNQDIRHKIVQRPAALMKWRALWKIIHPWVEEGLSDNDISGKIGENEAYKHLPSHPETIAKIRKAGSLGLLSDEISSKESP